MALKGEVGVTLAIGLGFSAILFISGGGATDRQGWAYDCPSPVRMFTDPNFIVIQPNYGGNGEDAEVIEGKGRPDGRRVYYQCRQSAGRRLGYGAMGILGTLGLAAYVNSRARAEGPSTTSPSPPAGPPVRPLPPSSVAPPVEAVPVTPQVKPSRQVQVQTIRYQCPRCKIVSLARTDQPNVELTCKGCGALLRGRI